MAWYLPEGDYKQEICGQACEEKHRANTASRMKPGYQLHPAHEGDWSWWRLQTADGGNLVQILFIS
jgi:hypothetical protein